MSDPSKLSQQELVDYLVQAVEEEDVLFCVLWLQEMARRGMVCSREGELKADGINLEHSWKKRSVLVTAVSGPATPFRHFILTLLLVHVRDVMSCAAMTAAIALRAMWAISVLTSWQSPAVQGTSIVRTPRELLAMSATEAADWIDANLPAHPSPESFTGCGPLPDPPQQNEAQSSSLTQAYSAPAAAALPTVPPASTVPPTASLADRRVRLCEIRSSINIGRLCNLLPPIEGLRETTPAGRNAAVLTFDSPELARKALLPLQGSEYFRAAVLESVFQAASKPDPCPPPAPSSPATTVSPVPPLSLNLFDHLPAVNVASEASSSSAKPAPSTRLPPIGWSPAIAKQGDGMRVHIGDLPVDVTREEVEALLAFAGVAYWALDLKRRCNRTSAYIRLSTREEFARISSVLHNSHFRGRRVRVEREAPSHISAEHPLVVIRNLPSHMGLHVVHNLGRLTRLGAYGEAMQPLEDGSAIGRFRVSSPVTAQEAADMLNGMLIDGLTISADWTNGDGSAPSRAPQSTADAVGGQLASFTATAAIPIDDQPGTATNPPMPAPDYAAIGRAPVHMPPSPLATPAPETPLLPEPFALPASSYSTPATFVANVTPPVSPEIVTKDLPRTTSDLWGQELQGRRKASSDGGGEERAAKRRK
ncbi:hypothetical protein NBRC10512_007481 [Rhodotorula toruloides]|uniref:RHTO0S06e00804g1_1 n=2 Tax=Rhodotorula toruloides TaxID=5286 RepID=A0A061AUL6_RHOTO|nr:nucleic acid binding protein [Rhodotorula toruloides NP11]EMS24028.1 nucleic acid binding protein [Rhodotorula toruloides NP11]CDR41332.1 RHTO0S06e00804g1_1 [Rhodotorula toruloides]